MHPNRKRKDKKHHKISLNWLQDIAEHVMRKKKGSDEANSVLTEYLV